MKYVPIEKVVADPTQPRQVFDPKEMELLSKSVEQKGILVPLIVEDRKDGTYLLIDGERRYRTAKKLKLKEVPIEIEPPMTPSERMIMRFHLQDQHSSWSPFDRARAIAFFMKDEGLTIPQTSELLGISYESVRGWVSILTLSKRSQSFAIEKRLPFSYLSRIATLTKLYLGISDLPASEIEMHLLRKLDQKEMTNQDEFYQLSRLFVKDEDPKRLIKFLTTEGYSFKAFMLDAQKGGDVKLDGFCYSVNGLYHRAKKLLAEGANKNINEVHIQKIKALNSILKELIS